MEGLVLMERDQDKDKSFTLDSQIFNNDTLKYIHDNDLSIVAISKSGLPTNGGTLAQDAALKYIKDKNLQIRSQDGSIYEGVDHQGNVIYIDYSMEDSQALVNY